MTGLQGRLIVCAVLSFPVSGWTQLAEGEGAMLVTGHCSACHSLQLVTAQRGDRTFWLNTIRWMQKTQKLWDIPADQEEVILSYLETHYNETQWGRRPPLPASLMPSQGGHAN